jgi:hypothetical protein
MAYGNVNRSIKEEYSSSIEVNLLDLGVPICKSFKSALDEANQHIPDGSKITKGEFLRDILEDALPKYFKSLNKAERKPSRKPMRQQSTQHRNDRVIRQHGEDVPQAAE